ncbi:transposase, MuDR, MULE transposase domain protein [Tanacetum coccineum]
MDGNNKIISIATGVLQGETGPDAQKKLVEAGFEKWSRPKCPANRYKYMTSNKVESINALTKDMRKIPITALMDWKLFHTNDVSFLMLDASDDELIPWATVKIKYRMLKSYNWTIKGVIKYKIYEVWENKRIHVVYLEKGECMCRKRELSGLPCGHVCVVASYEGLSSVNNLAKPWFLNKTIKGTYEGIIYPVKDISTWQTPHDLQLLLPPVMGKKLPGRPKDKDRIRSQGEGPIITKCGRCGAMGHNRSGSNVPLPKFQLVKNRSQPSRNHLIQVTASGTSHMRR